MVRLIAALAVSWLIASPARPALASQDDRALSLVVGYATYAMPDGRVPGTTLGVDYDRGFSEAMALRLSAASGLFFAERRTVSGQATVGVSYVLDVLKYVPFVHAGLGAVALRDAAQGPRMRALLQLDIGLDVLHGRNVSWGAVIRYGIVLGDTSLLSAAVRLSWRWGFF